VPVLAAAALWGTVGPAQVLARSAASPAALGAARLLVGGAVLFVAMPLLTDRVRFRMLLRRPTLGWLLLAAVSTAAFQAAFLTSVTRTGAALATVVALGMAPPAAGVTSRIVTGERFSRTWTIATVGAVAGTALLLLPGAVGGVDPVGVALGIAAGTCYGLYTVAAKMLLADGTPTFAAIAATLVLGGLILSPALVVDPATLLEPRTVALVGWLALPATALGYVLFVGGLARVSAATAGTLSLAEPLVAAAAGLLLLGERLTLPAAAGATVLLAGLLAVALPRSAPRSVSPRGGWRR